MCRKYFVLFFLFLLGTFSISFAQYDLASGECLTLQAKIQRKGLYKSQVNNYVNDVYICRDEVDSILGFEILLVPKLTWSNYRWYYKRGNLYEMELSDSTVEVEKIEKFGFYHQAFLQMYMSVPMEFYKDFDTFSSQCDTVISSLDMYDRRRVWLVTGKMPTKKEYAYTSDSFNRLLRFEFDSYYDGDTEYVHTQLNYELHDTAIYSFEELIHQFESRSSLKWKFFKKRKRDDDLISDSPFNIDSAIQDLCLNFFAYNTDAKFLILDFWYYGCKYCHPMNDFLKTIIHKDSIHVYSLYSRSVSNPTIAFRLSENYTSYDSLVYLGRKHADSLGVNTFPRIIILDRELNVRADLIGYSEDNLNLIRKTLNIN